MVARLPRVCILSFLFICSVSYAGMERFWTLSKDKDQEAIEQLDECENLSREQQHQLIKTYQSLRDEAQKLDLRKRMEWFCQLPDDEQDRMRIAWQNMSTTERNKLKKQLQNTTDLEKRAELRREIIEKYGNIN